MFLIVETTARPNQKVRKGKYENMIDYGNNLRRRK